MLLPLLLGCPGPLPKGDAARPDIVLISIDSLRADHLSAYGYDRTTSPNLDRLARRGLRFVGARAASPWTLPSHMTMLTGRWPTEHNVVEDDIALAPDVPLVQEALSNAGYTTAGFVSTIYVSGGYGFSRGFGTFKDYGIAEHDNLAHPVRVETLVEDALLLAKEKGSGAPLFLFIHIYDVHYPYLPPTPWDEKFDRVGTPEEMRYHSYRYFQKRPLSAKRMEHQVAQYDEGIAYVDNAIGRLKEAWDDSDRPAYWIVTADHGEEFGERGSWGHAHTLYREALEIPLLVAGPGIEAAVRTERAGTIDLAATIAAMAGVSWPHGPGVDLRGAVPDRTFIAETSRFDSARLSIATQDRRLDLDLTDGQRTVFDLTTDPREEHGSADSAQADALEQQLWPLLGEHWVADGGTVRTLGLLWSGNARVGQSLVGPARFGLYPSDASVYLDASPPFRGVVTAPAAGLLRYEGPRTAVGITLADDTRAQLEALGYLQAEPEE
ncbi:MAG: sulfatase [Pseudomonadota bacterium]|nr:sulfatase [Pseudomonadota bacterium]